MSDTARSQSTLFSSAQRTALVGLLRCGGTMLVEIGDGKELDIGAACAVACLSQCLGSRYVTHEQISDGCGKFSLTRLGRSAAEFLDGLEEVSDV